MVTRGRYRTPAGQTTSLRPSPFPHGNVAHNSARQRTPRVKPVSSIRLDREPGDSGYFSIDPAIIIHAMQQQLSSWDLLVIAAYLAGMIALGVRLSWGQRSDDEYFLAGRRMPWFAVGMSVIASLLSSLTYLSEPGEVWNSGITHSIGKMLAIPIEMAVVWVFCVPFLMRFRYTSAYEYLEHRFGLAARRIGAGLFILMVVLWMGFVVLASSRALAVVSGFSLLQIMLMVGVVATAYTVMGGLRAVIWTDVVQVILLIGGGLFCIAYVSWTTGTWLPDWYAAAERELAPNAESVPWFSFDPTVRATVVTVAINMAIWHICTHTANQMTVQRYFSTSDVRAARRSFVTGSLLGVGINLMLVVVGLAMLFYYTQSGVSLDGLDPNTKQDRDLIFPMFAVRRLPPGFGGAILAALFAAAMSSIDSGVNSIATVLTAERFRDAEESTPAKLRLKSHVLWARVVTLTAGVLITIAAYGLSFLPSDWGIVDAMPRTFNAVTAPLGAMFLIGIFLPFCGQRAMLIGTGCGLLTSIGLGYLSQIGDALVSAGVLGQAPPSISFTWIMPMALLVAILTAAAASLIFPAQKRAPGLTWFDRKA